MYRPWLLLIKERKSFALLLTPPKTARSIGDLGRCTTRRQIRDTTQKGVTLPADDAKVVSPAPLAAKSGTDFDQEFVKMIIQDHQNDIAAFEKEASSGSDPDLKNWASKALPTLRAHLTEAQAIPKAASNLQ